MYLVSFSAPKSSNRDFSRAFSTKAAALKWARWLRSHSYVGCTFVHHGQGGALIEERAR